MFNKGRDIHRIGAGLAGGLLQAASQGVTV